MAKKNMVKVYCDFCNQEIEKSTPVVGGEVTLADANNADQIIDVDIRVGSTEPRKRFPHDICRGCVFRAVAELDNAEIDRPEA